MRRHLRFPTSIALGLATLLAFAGCSNLPTQPAMGAGSPLNPVVTTGTSSETLSLLGGTTSTATKTVQIVGLLGGVVSAGDFTVVIPPLAISGTATVTVSQPDVSHSTVNLSIYPASANKFALPVVLIANAKRLDASLLATSYISYYNPATGQWEPRASTVDLLGFTVSTPLSHFSTYRVECGGKAGW